MMMFIHSVSLSHADFSPKSGIRTHDPLYPKQENKPPLSLRRSFAPFDLPVQETVEQKHSSFGTKYFKIQDTKKASRDGDASMNVQLKPFHRNLPCISCNSAQVSCCPAGTLNLLMSAGRILIINTCFMFSLLIPATICFGDAKLKPIFESTKLFLNLFY